MMGWIVLGIVVLALVVLAGAVLVVLAGLGPLRRAAARARGRAIDAQTLQTSVVALQRGLAEVRHQATAVQNRLAEIAKSPAGR